MALEMKDRLILRNQYAILAQVHPEDKEYYLRKVEVLERGYEAEYADLMRDLSTPFSESQCAFVMDVLAMYDQIEWAKGNGAALPAKGSYLLNFRGFDGNNEHPYLSYAEFLIKQPGKWDSLKKKETNSHTPMVTQYHNMLASWKQSADQNDLTAEDFIRIAENI